MKRFNVMVLFLAVGCRLWALSVADVAVERDSVSLTAQWAANTESDLAGYKVYLSAHGHSAEPFTLTSYEYVVDVKLDTFYQIVWPDSLPVYVRVVAYDVSGNVSEPSIEAAWAPLSYFDREPKNGFISPFDGYLFNTLYGYERGMLNYDTAYDLDGSGIISPLDKTRFSKNYGRSTDEIFLVK